MKKLKCGFMIFAIIVIASFFNLNAQAVHIEIPFPDVIFGPCADNGNGEDLVGDLTVYILITKTGIVAHPNGGFSIDWIGGSCENHNHSVQID